MTDKFCKFCGNTGYYQIQKSYDRAPCPCKHCTELVSPPADIGAFVEAMFANGHTPMEAFGVTREMISELEFKLTKYKRGLLIG